MVVFLKVKRPQFLVNAPYIVISQLGYDIIKVLQAELSVQLIEILQNLCLKAILEHVFVLHLPNRRFLRDQIILR